MNNAATPETYSTQSGYFVAESSLEAEDFLTANETSSSDLDLVLDLDLVPSVVRTVAVSVVVAVLSVVTCAGNLLVMISFKMDRQLQTISNCFLLSLSVADFAIGFVSMPLYTVYLVMERWVLGPFICDAWLSLDYTMSNASVANLLIISFDRYFSVTRPLTYRARRTPRKAACLIAVAWGISVLLWTPWIWTWPYIEGGRKVPDDQCFIQFLATNQYITVFTAIAAFFLPVLIMFIIYFKIYQTTETRRKQLEYLQPMHFKPASKARLGVAAALLAGRLERSQTWFSDQEQSLKDDSASAAAQAAAATDADSGPTVGLRCATAPRPLLICCRTNGANKDSVEDNVSSSNSSSIIAGHSFSSGTATPHILHTARIRPDRSNTLRRKMADYCAAAAAVTAGTANSGYQGKKLFRQMAMSTSVSGTVKPSDDDMMESSCSPSASCTAFQNSRTSNVDELSGVKDAAAEDSEPEEDDDEEDGDALSYLEDTEGPWVLRDDLTQRQVIRASAAEASPPSATSVPAALAHHTSNRLYETGCESFWSIDRPFDSPAAAAGGAGGGSSRGGGGAPTGTTEMLRMASRFLLQTKKFQNKGQERRLQERKAAKTLIGGIQGANFC